MALPIQVVLEKDVENLGRCGDVVRVRPGFARNFLMVRGLALPATKGNLARIDELKRLAARRTEKERQQAHELKARIEAVMVSIERAVGDERKLYGSVSAKDIAQAYQAQGVSLDRRKIQLKSPIRELGTSELSIRLHPEVTATLRVEVKKKA
ncbi:MAG TPA: 50S ribosomal protein L9 [Polyangiaceae bacterium]|jgi:large subunit ribosomal protein L9